LLTGRAPFPGKTVTEVVARVVHGAHIPPTQAEARLPAACDAVFEQVFAAAPERRHQRAGDFVRALAEALRSVQNLVLAREPQPRKWDLADGALVPTQWTPSDTSGELPPHPTPGPTSAAAEASLGATSLLPAPAGALLLVDSQPRGARVSLGGRSLGSTPLEALALPYGRHQLHLTQAGHEALTIEVDLGPGKALQHVSATLQPLERGDPGEGRVVPFRPGMVPPRRVEGTLPEWPIDALGPAPSGVVEVEIVVGERGEIVGLEVLHSGGERLDAAMLAALSRWHFSPASLAGRAVATRLRVRHQFGG
jgi:TonB family protein